MEISNKADMIKAAEKIHQKINRAVLIKGGHLLGDATDLLFTDNSEKWFLAERVIIQIPMVRDVRYRRLLPVILPWILVWKRALKKLKNI